jgi:hypothetical protein
MPFRDQKTWKRSQGFKPYKALGQFGISFAKSGSKELLQS